MIFAYYNESNTGIELYDDRALETRVPSGSVMVEGQDFVDRIASSPSKYWVFDGRVRVKTAFIEEARKNREVYIRDGGQTLLASIISPYESLERLTWTIQALEAEGWLKDNAFPTPMIDQLYVARGIDKADFVNKVMENNLLFRTYGGQILGTQQALLDALWGIDITISIDSSGEEILDAIASISWP